MIECTDEIQLNEKTTILHLNTMHNECLQLLFRKQYQKVVHYVGYNVFQQMDFCKKHKFFNIFLSPEPIHT